MKKGAKVALLGENYFPPLSESHMSNRRGRAIERVMSAIFKYKPSVVYVCPTKGVNINILPMLLLNNIRFRLVFPSRHFFSLLNGDEKLILEAASQKADKLIILSEEKCDPMRWSDDWYKGTKKAIDNADWVMIVHNSFCEDKGFNDLVLKFNENPKPCLAVALDEEE